MMTASQKISVGNAISKVWNLMAGDAVIAVMKPVELITNGSFDSGTTGWDVTGWTYSSVNHNVIHNTDNTTPLGYSTIGIVSGGTYELTFNVSGRSTGTITAKAGNTAGTTRALPGTYTQEFVTSNNDGILFTPSTDFDGAIDSVSCVLIQKPLITIAHDYTSASKFTEGLQIDNSGATLQEARELTFLSSYLDALLIDIHDVDYWLINGERWDFIKDAPILTELVPIAGIHNIVVVSIRKAAELEQSQTVTGSFTFE